MHLSKISIRNFRQFGSEGVNVEFQPGVSILVGPNDSGKTAIIDAIRYVLTTRDQEYSVVQRNDFHVTAAGDTAKEIVITCEFSRLSVEDKANFVEYLSVDDESKHTLILQWKAIPKESGSRSWTQTTLTVGPDGEGTALDAVTRHLLACAYLKPLRDAEREMASGRNSRLSQVLANYPDISSGEEFDPEDIPQSEEEAKKLSLSGLSNYLRHLVNGHDGVDSASRNLNDDYLSQLSLVHDNLKAEINFVSGSNGITRLKQILERLELNFTGDTVSDTRGRYGLGSNNLLYMACELLLLSKDSGGFPLLLVEEPEAHLHPQRQLQLMQFLKEKSSGKDPIQVIVSTHSPVLASKAKVNNLIMVGHGKVFSLAEGKTKLSGSDYSFLERFLDATKSNLFFANSVVIVEGDAEELILPTIARLLGRDFTKYGVSIVNVGSTALRRYSRVFQRSDPKSQSMDVRVASLCDRDILPDEAVDILGLKLEVMTETGNRSQRKWRTESDPLFGSSPDEIAIAKDARLSRLTADDDQGVKSFPANHWTLEYDLALAGLGLEIYQAVCLAKADDRIHDDSKPSVTEESVIEVAMSSYKSTLEGKEVIERSVHIYKDFHDRKVSKAITAQYLAKILESKYSNDPETLASLLPKYVSDAIEYVTLGVE